MNMNMNMKRTNSNCRVLFGFILRLNICSIVRQKSSPKIRGGFIE